MGIVNLTFGARSAAGEVIILSTSSSETLDVSDGEAHGSGSVPDDTSIVRVLADADIAIADSAEALADTDACYHIRADQADHVKLKSGAQLFIKLL